VGFAGPAGIRDRFLGWSWASLPLNKLRAKRGEHSAEEDSGVDLREVYFRPQPSGKYLRWC